MCGDIQWCYQCQHGDLGWQWLFLTAFPELWETAFPVHMRLLIKGIFLPVLCGVCSVPVETPSWIFFKYISRCDFFFLFRKSWKFPSICLCADVEVGDWLLTWTPEERGGREERGTFFMSLLEDPGCRKKPGEFRIEGANILELHKRKLIQRTTSYSHYCLLLPLDHFSDPSILRESHPCILWTRRNVQILFHLPTSSYFPKYKIRLCYFF